VNSTQVERNSAIEIARIATAYAQSRILHSAVELNLFSELAQVPMSCAELCAKLGLNEALTAGLLRALEAVGLLDARDGRYVTSDLARQILLPGGPVNLVDYIKVTSTRHFALWSNLTGELTSPERSVNGRMAFETAYADPVMAARFLAHMDSARGLIMRSVVQSIDWTTFQTFADIGGARGELAARISLACPHLRGTVFELPPVQPLFAEHMVRRGTTETVRFSPGDFFIDDLPRADVLILGHVLHDWAPDAQILLLEKVYNAVNDGGLVLIYDQMIDPDRPDVYTMIASMNVSLVTGSGSEYTLTECQERVMKAGFAVERCAPVESIGNDLIVIGRKAVAKPPAA
jgi:hypothetical protein